MMTEQQIFDISARHLLTQMKRSVPESGVGCCYRGPNGLQCAAGPFVVDDVVNHKVDSFSGPKPANESAFFRLKDEWIISELRDCRDSVQWLIRELQEIHDFNNPITWYHLLWELAKSNNLDKEVLYEFNSLD